MKTRDACDRDSGAILSSVRPPTKIPIGTCRLDRNSSEQQPWEDATTGLQYRVHAPQAGHFRFGAVFIDSCDRALAFDRSVPLGYQTCPAW